MQKIFISILVIYIPALLFVESIMNPVKNPFHSGLAKNRLGWYYKLAWEKNLRSLDNKVYLSSIKSTQNSIDSAWYEPSDYMYHDQFLNNFYIRT